MALKRKIDKAAFEALPDVLKSEYKLVGNDYVLDTDDAADLKAAKDREVEARKAAEKAAKDAQAALDALTEKQNRENGDVAALDASYKTKLAALEKERDTLRNDLENERRDRYVNSEAEKIAKRFTVPALMKDVIAKRLSVEHADGKPLVRVLDANGKPSALSVAELEKELVDNPDYKGIVIGSKANGSADTSPRVLPLSSAKSGASPTNNDGNLAKMPAKDLLAHVRAVANNE